MSVPANLRLVHRTFTSKVQLRQARGTPTRPLTTVESIIGASGETPTGPGPSSLLRTASFNGVACTVVPIVALVGDIVLQAANAPAPELVPLYCLESLPLAAWNGRPIVPLHPNDGEQYISANDPVTLDKYGFGLTFNAAISNGALQLDGYLNPVRAAVVGPLANDVLARLATDELIEVSVGVSVLVSDEAGTIKSLSGEDVSYSAIWEQLLYVDHVAMLPAGVEGACSVKEGGCGAPRIQNNVTLSDGGSIMAVETQAVKATDSGTKVAKVAKVAASTSVMVSPDPSEIFYGNMRERLRQAIYDRWKIALAAAAPVPGTLDVGSNDDGDIDDLYVWVRDFSNRSVVYSRGESYSSNQLYKCSYTVDAATGSIALADDESEVIEQNIYKPAGKFSALMGKIREIVAQAVLGDEGAEMVRSLAGARHSSKDQMLIQSAHDNLKDLGASCPVDEKNVASPTGSVDYADPIMKPMEAATGDSPTPAPCSCKGGSKAMAMTKEAKTALVTKILSAPGSTFKEDQRAALEATDEVVLTVLVGATPVDPEGGKPKEVVVVAQAPAAPPASPVTLTPDQWWAQAPPEMANIRSLAARAAESDKLEKETLIKALATAQEAFTEPQLTAMDLTGLRSLASLTGLFLPRFDYTGAAGALTRDAASSTEAKESQVYNNPPKPFDLMRAAKGKSNGKLTGDNSATPEAN